MFIRNLATAVNCYVHKLEFDQIILVVILVLLTNIELTKTQVAR